MILIIADAFDTHAAVVIKHLQDIGRPTFRLNLDVASLEEKRFNFDGAQWVINQNGKTLIAEDVKVVWPRRLTVSLTLEQQSEPESGNCVLELAG